VNKTIGPITITLDMTDAANEAQSVADELLRRVNELSPRISEGEALRILLVDMTRDYLKAKSQAEQITE